MASAHAQHRPQHLLTVGLIALLIALTLGTGATAMGEAVASETTGELATNTDVILGTGKGKFHALVETAADLEDTHGARKSTLELRLQETEARRRRRRKKGGNGVNPILVDCVGDDNATPGDVEKVAPVRNRPLDECWMRNSFKRTVFPCTFLRNDPKKHHMYSLEKTLAFQIKSTDYISEAVEIIGTLSDKFKSTDRGVLRYRMANGKQRFYCCEDSSTPFCVVWHTNPAQENNLAQTPSITETAVDAALEKHQKERAWWFEDNPLAGTPEKERCFARAMQVTPQQLPRIFVIAMFRVLNAHKLSSETLDIANLRLKMEDHLRKLTHPFVTFFEHLTRPDTETVTLKNPATRWGAFQELPLEAIGKRVRDLVSKVPNSKKVTPESYNVLKLLVTMLQNEVGAMIEKDENIRLLFGSLTSFLRAGTAWVPLVGASVSLATAVFDKVTELGLARDAVIYNFDSLLLGQLSLALTMKDIPANTPQEKIEEAKTNELREAFVRFMEFFGAMFSPADPTMDVQLSLMLDDCRPIDSNWISEVYRVSQSLKLIVSQNKQLATIPFDFRLNAALLSQMFNSMTRSDDIVGDTKKIKEEDKGIKGLIAPKN